MVDFTPSINPIFPIVRKKQPRILFNEFGDGYTQRAADGLNTSPLMLSLTWDLLTATQRQEIVDFFEARASHESFNWTLPDTLETFKFICLTWDDNLIYYDQYSIQASFKQVFDIN